MKSRSLLSICDDHLSIWITISSQSLGKFSEIAGKSLFIMTSFKTFLLTEMIGLNNKVPFGLFFVVRCDGTSSVRSHHPSFPLNCLFLLWSYLGKHMEMRNITLSIYRLFVAFLFNSGSSGREYIERWSFFMKNHFSSMWIRLLKKEKHWLGKSICCKQKFNCCFLFISQWRF